jgi:hypothetical protein
LSIARDEELQEEVSSWIRYASTAGLDVSALLLAALCHFAAGDAGPGLEATVPTTVPDHYYPH